MCGYCHFSKACLEQLLFCIPDRARAAHHRVQVNDDGQGFVHGKNVLTCEPRHLKGAPSVLLDVMNRIDLRERLHAGALKLAEE